MNNMNTMIYCPKTETIIITKDVLNDLYNICDALVAITEIECCNYNFDEELLNAKNFIAEYDKYEREKKQNED